MSQSSQNPPLSNKKQVGDKRYEARGGMRKIFIKDICNILLLSLILTLRNQLSTICAADGPPFLSRKELRFANFPFAILRFHTAEEVQHITVVPIDSHTAFYFPPAFAGPPFSPERETCYRLSVRATFVFFPLFNKTFRFTPAIPQGCTVSRI